MKTFVVASVLIFGLSAGNAIAFSSHTLVPEFRAGQHIYLDPLIKAHSSAPFDFSDSFKQKADASNVYVAAAQKGDEPVPEGKKLGVAKVDELIAKWAGNPQFNKQDYIAIFWVRRADDPSKGSVGANVGSEQRSHGITPSVLNEIVAESLKANMPQDPEGAIARVAGTIQAEMLEYQDQQAREAEESAKVAAFLDAAKDAFWFAIKTIVCAVPFGIATFWYRHRMSRRRKLEYQASSLVLLWKKVLDNAGIFYTDLIEKYVGQLEVLDIAKCDEVFQLACHKAIGEVAFFMDMKQQGDKVLNSARNIIESGDLNLAVNLLSKQEIHVTGAEVPLAVASLLTGPHRLLVCDGAEFLDQLEKQFQVAKDELIFILEQYNSAEEKYKTLETLLKSTDDYLRSQSFTTNSYFDLNGIEIKGYLTDVSEGVRLLVKAKTAFERSDITGLAKTTETMMAWSDNVIKPKKEIIESYFACEKGLRSLVSVEDFEQKLALAEQSCALVARDFPSHRSKSRDLLDRCKVDIENYAQLLSEMKPLYAQADFRGLLALIHSCDNTRARIIPNLNEIINEPDNLRKMQLSKAAKLQEQKKKAQKLRRYSWNSTTESTVNRHLDVGDFVQAQALIDSLDGEIASAKRSEESSYSSSSSSSGWASSSSDYSSSSSSSDYSSSSGGSDY